VEGATGGFVLRLRPEGDTAWTENLVSGRFFMVRREDGESPAIPRPFSVYRVEDGCLDFLIQTFGLGTAALAACEEGTPLRLVGPAGNGWPELTVGPEPWVFLAGGIGSAPFLMALEQSLPAHVGASPRAPGPWLLYGAAAADRLYEHAAFEATGAQVLCATDDGSHGFHGNVIGLLEQEWAAGRIPERVRLLACGPERMLTAVARLAADRELSCWFSLETYMGCGVGICSGCAVPTNPEGPLGDWPSAKCCVEGPVFESSAILI
jgi:dihydroorotate dehydrogenase electron transfer subunit